MNNWSTQVQTSSSSPECERIWALSLSGLLNSLVQPTWVLPQKSYHQTHSHHTDVPLPTRRRHSPEGTLVLLEGLVNQHVSLYFVLPVERGLTDGAFIRLLSCKTTRSVTVTHLICFWDFLDPSETQLYKAKTVFTSKGHKVCGTWVDLCVEFEVVLCFEELFTDLTFEFAADAVRGEMPAEIPLARKHLTDTNTFSADIWFIWFFNMILWTQMFRCWLLSQRLNLLKLNLWFFFFFTLDKI